MIEPAQGNLLTAPTDALVNTVNTEGVMGKGIALQFKNAFPTMFTTYAQAAKAGQVRLGHMHVFDRGGIGDGPRWIINFPTKGHWRARSRLADVASGLDDLISTIQRLGIKSIAVPPLGCGNGGLDWSQVRPLIMKAFARVPDVHVLLFEPTGAPPVADMPNRTPRPKLTKASATLLVLMSRYIQGLLEPFVTQLEAQKLMYFMQEAGQELKLTFQADRYGPYAPNLGHVLKRLDSHYLTGMGDGDSSPGRPLMTIPEGVDEARDLLARDDTTNKRIERVARLIDGFEDPHGMELLSTMLWVMVHHEEARESPSAAIEHVHAWSERKCKLLPADHLEKAWERLRAQEWHFMARSIHAEPMTH